jgi:hypothetical protein
LPPTGVGTARSTQTSDGHDMDHCADDLAAVIGTSLRSVIHIGAGEFFDGGGEFFKVHHFFEDAPILRYRSHLTPSVNGTFGDLVWWARALRSA